MMKINIITAVCLLASTNLYSQTKFPMGDGLDKWGLPIKFPESDLSLRLGARFQSLATIRTSEENNTSTTSGDFQSRRVRLQFEAMLPRDIFFYMDVRNDNANAGDRGEQSFNIGDAFVQYPLVKTDHYAHAVRLFRAKVDVSRTETVSSSEILFVNRAFIADEAAQFVNHNRRATNVQLIGNFFEKISYQVAIGDGVQSDRFHDARGEDIQTIERQNFMIGGKLRFFPFQGWADLKPTETYFGKGKHFSFGAGFFNTSNIFIENANGVNDTVSRNLSNVEISGHYEEWFFSGEYFIFDGVIENHNTTTNYNTGKSEGWYVQGEKIFPHLYWLAPYVRYEKWDRFITSGNYLTTDQLYGLNWYLNGNRFKMSLAYEVTTNGNDTGMADRSEAYHWSTAWHF